MKKEKAAPSKNRSAAGRAKAPEASKAPSPTVEGVAAHLLALGPADEPPAPWKEADLKRRLSAAERPQFPAALARLQGDRHPAHGVGSGCRRGAARPVGGPLA